MTKDELMSLKLQAYDEKTEQKIRENWDRVAKPIDGLGDLERLIAGIGAVQGTERPAIDRRGLLIFCADNGVVDEGVSQSGREVTAEVARLMGRDLSSVCTMARALSAAHPIEILPVDIGIEQEGPFEGVLDRKVMRGTANLAKGPAMTEEACLQAISVGMELVKERAKSGIRILATGEMGIGNTTTSALLACAVLKRTPEELAGRGAGLTDEGMARKIAVMKRALALHAPGFMERETVSPEEAFDLLCRLGGLDIAGLVGAFLGGAMCRVPVIIDGVISAAAGLIASKICPESVHAMLPSHAGKEQSIRPILAELGLRPVIEGELALGEGTGAILLFPLLDAALALYEKGTGFADTPIGQYERHES